MNALLPNYLKNQILLGMGEHAASQWMLTLAAHLSMQGGVRVLDAGNRFNVYPVARTIRFLGGNPNIHLEQIRLSRAFTCYQVDTMLREWQGADPVLLVFDLLSTFYDENVDLAESMRLLDKVLTRLAGLSGRMPVVVSTRLPAAINADRLVLFEHLKEMAGDVHLELPPAAESTSRQLCLLPEE